MEHRLDRVLLRVPSRGVRSRATIGVRVQRGVGARPCIVLAVAAAPESAGQPDLHVVVSLRLLLVHVSTSVGGGMLSSGAGAGAGIPGGGVSLLLLA